MRAVQEQAPLNLLRQQTALAKFGELTLRSDDLDHILTEGCRLVAEAVGTELAKVMALQADGETLLVRAGVGWKPGVVGEVSLKATDNTSEGLALRTGEPMTSPDIAAETRFTYPPFLTENGVHAVANVVIIGGVGKPPFGILQVDSLAPRNFSEEDTAFLQSYANLLAAAVDRLHVIEAVRDGEARLRFALESAALASWELDLTLGTITWVAGYEQIFGYAVPPAVSTYDSFLTQVLPEDREMVIQAFRRVRETGAECRFTCRVTPTDDGRTRWIDARGVPVGGLQTTSPARIVGIMSDITERVRTEERVRQSQRVEAVGRLTSGIAHDFNNLLQLLIGGLEIAIEGVADRPLVRAEVDLALQAGRRGARLTSHLLSFSRQQALRPTDLDLSKLLDDLAHTLRRTLGPHIAVDVEVTPDLGRVRADSSHLDSALLNLALNARDAMPRGGTLRIAAYSIGERVVIALSDTGDGMTADVLTHACEPFFSTKGSEGSGLGLSMVQGFAHQSGGDLRIHSTPGQGTRIELWLPMVVHPPTSLAPAGVRNLRGRGFVLVVDDDEAVSRVIAVLLRGVGFDVIKATSGADAMIKLRDNPLLDVLVTDFAMVGMNGVELIEHARALYSTLAVLVITGNAGVRGLDRLPPTVTILNKPFGRLELVSAVATLMDARENASC